MSDNTQQREHDANEDIISSWHNFLDLPVAISVELGRTRYAARDILQLENDSIIQLPRSTGEGVDVIAGGRRVARGEIVMIEDRSGVRINEMISGER